MVPLDVGVSPNSVSKSLPFLGSQFGPVDCSRAKDVNQLPNDFPQKSCNILPRMSFYPFRSACRPLTKGAFYTMTAESQIPTVANHRSDGRPHRVLFVDDEPLIARLGEQFLRRLGYDTVVHTDPTQALDCFASNEFDLVITDLSMPRLSGLELGELLREQRPEQRIILTTAYHSMLEGRDVHELGFCDFLPKPYNLESLKQAIKRALETV